MYVCTYLSSAFSIRWEVKATGGNYQAAASVERMLSLLFVVSCCYRRKLTSVEILFFFLTLRMRCCF